MSVAENLHEVLKTISETNANHEPTLVAVSKTVPAAVAMEAYEAGQRHFGENRIPSLEEKIENMPTDIHWHFIGRIQSNKIRRIVQLATWIHSIDSISHLEKIERAAADEGKTPKVLIQVNTSGEESKTGFDCQSVDEIVPIIKSCQNAQVVGLMTMAPFTEDEDILRDTFHKLRATRDRLETEFGLTLPELSMGMSNDYPIAIEEGATLVRVGSSIFA